jgi:hypothetical protein
MFSLPQPSNDVAPDELPVVGVSESAEVLNSLISMLYPVPPEMPHSIDNILALLAATDKYDMGAVQSSIRAEVSRKELLSPTDSAGAFRMYAVACSKRLIPEMDSEAAARLTLNYPLTFESVGETLRLFDGWALRRLADFRLRCVRNLTSWVKSVQDGASIIWAKCPSVRCFTDPPDLPSWLGAFKFLVADSHIGFAEAMPSFVQFGENFLKALRDHVEESDCNICSKVYILKGKAYIAELKDILKIARKVPFRILGDVPGV